MVIWTIVAWFYSAVIVSLLKDILSGQISLPCSWGWACNRFLPATLLEECEGAGNTPGPGEWDCARPRGTAVPAAPSRARSVGRPRGLEPLQTECGGPGQPTVQLGLSGAWRQSRQSPDEDTNRHAGSTREKKPKSVVPAVLAEKERAFVAFPPFPKKCSNAVLLLCEHELGPEGLGRTIKPDTERTKPKGGKNPDNGAEGRLDGGGSGCDSEEGVSMWTNTN